tara:strand:+ start:224 stop:379 length:156 start_codon:yes stop_codon:yes gene_type:complete
MSGDLDWSRLLDPANGGPGEPPGREEATEAAMQLTKTRQSKGKKKRNSKRK